MEEYRYAKHNNISNKAMPSQIAEHNSNKRKSPIRSGLFFGQWCISEKTETAIARLANLCVGSASTPMKTVDEINRCIGPRCLDDVLQMGPR